MQPQTDEQRGKRACALTASGSTNKAVKRLVGGAAQGSADCRKNWTAALIPRSSGSGTHPTSAECAEAARTAWGGGRHKAAWSAMREQGRSKKGIASLPHVKLALDPTGERRERLDAIVSFAGAGQRPLLFRGLDILTIEWAIGDLPEECRFLLDTQLMFLQREMDLTSQQVDDDEWIRSLTEAQEITADVPEDSVLYDQQAVDPKKKVRPIRTGELLRKCVSRRLLALSEGAITAFTSANHLPESKSRREKWLRND